MALTEYGVVLATPIGVRRIAATVVTLMARASPMTLAALIETHVKPFTMPTQKRLARSLGCYLRTPTESC